MRRPLRASPRDRHERSHPAVAVEHQHAGGGARFADDGASLTARPPSVHVITASRLEGCCGLTLRLLMLRLLLIEMSLVGVVCEAVLRILPQEAARCRILMMRRQQVSRAAWPGVVKPGMHGRKLSHAWRGPSLAVLYSACSLRPAPPAGCRHPGAPAFRPRKRKLGRRAAAPRERRNCRRCGRGG